MLPERFKTVMLMLFVALFVVHAKEEVAVDPDAGLNTTQIIQARGYVVETHKVTTADRYVLMMHRIPKSYAESQTNSAAAANKPVVYMQHGLLDSSYTWVLNYRNQSLAFILADLGYDVWLGNNRGNTWSKEHLDYTTDDNEFWDFTWEDMGNYDLPAMINYALSVSGRSMLSYIGDGGDHPSICRVLQQPGTRQGGVLLWSIHAGCLDREERKMGHRQVSSC